MSEHVTDIMWVLAIAAVCVVLMLGLLGMFKAFYVKVPQGTALIVNDLSSTPKVHFTGALIIPVLIPLALRGVRFKPASAVALLRRNMLVYGLGGVLLPFAGIKLIDIALAALGV